MNAGVNAGGMEVDGGGWSVAPWLIGSDLPTSATLDVSEPEFAVFTRVGLDHTRGRA